MAYNTVGTSQLKIYSSLAVSYFLPTFNFYSCDIISYICHQARVGAYQSFPIYNFQYILFAAIIYLSVASNYKNLLILLLTSTFEKTMDVSVKAYGDMVFMNCSISSKEATDNLTMKQAEPAIL